MRETLLVEQFYNKIFFFWFEIMVAKGEIKAPKFFTLDRLGKEAYTNKTFRGITMPHVDPLKEVNAARAILGDNFKNVPLGDLDTQIDKISNADSTQVLAKAEKEMNNTRVFSANAEKEKEKEKEEKENTENL